MAGRIEARLKDLGIELPAAAVPVGSYVAFARSGTTLYIAGQLPFRDGVLSHTGKLGQTVSLEEGRAAARQCGLNLLAQMRAACGGDLDRVVRVLKLGGFVNCGPDFLDHPKVVNGASDLMAEVLGEAGRHARSAVGAPSLPLDAAVEVDAVVEIA
ncbi:MAG: RidA family protein [Azospirillum sp.]|nr:RidA family protein [Azospirillum sp.]